MRLNALQLTGRREAAREAPVVSVDAAVNSCQYFYFLALLHVVDSHLRSQRAAVQMLYDRVKLIAQYVSDVNEGL